SSVISHQSSVKTDPAASDVRPGVRRGERAGLTVAEARRQLEQLEQEQAAGRRVTVNLSWSIAEKT
ncbi:MAG TPA: hypothetical protein VJ739_13905, partial [Gemmataceae bacterium]|nr:hypothetical protein [Gemmataceae bacterium]